MSDLKTVLKEFTELGSILNVADISRLKYLLSIIYSHYLDASFEFDKKDFDEAPNFDYKEIRKNVELNFPDLGLYHSLFESHQISKDADLVIGDGVDDLSDIIRDMLDVKWRFENTSNNDALWHFDLLMRSHSEQHLVDLLKHLKDLES
ncbi:MAG: hypothetical protein ACJAUJ_001110 [Salibacteraceae bacterium]|jgi:hypothetical protein